MMIFVFLEMAFSNQYNDGKQLINSFDELMNTHSIQNETLF